MHGVGFEPTRFTTPGLKSGSLDHSDNRAFEQFKDLFRSFNYNVCCKHNYIQTTYKPINTIYTTKYAVIFNETPNGDCLSLSPDYLIRTGDLSISHIRRSRDTTTVDCSAN